MAEAPPTPAHEIVDNMPNRPAIKHGFRACCYCPHTDEIQMAAASSFATAADYFSTIYHEMTHSSGHKSRLGRLENKRRTTAAGIIRGKNWWPKWARRSCAARRASLTAP